MVVPSEMRGTILTSVPFARAYARCFFGTKTFPLTFNRQEVPHNKTCNGNAQNPSGKAGKGRCGALGKGSFHEAVRSRLMRKRKEKEQGNTNSNKEKKPEDDSLHVNRFSSYLKKQEKEKPEIRSFFTPRKSIP